MKTPQIMTVSAVLLIAAGIAASFAPDELAALLQSEHSSQFTITVQLLGALWFAFGMVNWTAKETIIGGVYGRPVAIGNLTHFTIGALALLKVCTRIDAPVWLWVLAGIYTVFALLFARIFFRPPQQ